MLCVLSTGQRGKHPRNDGALRNDNYGFTGFQQFHQGLPRRAWRIHPGGIPQQRVDLNGDTQGVGKRLRSGPAAVGKRRIYLVWVIRGEHRRQCLGLLAALLIQWPSVISTGCTGPRGGAVGMRVSNVQNSGGWFSGD